ncbi:unnamed protein product [Danaus chrysippus]|uniref:(African queen) hypothetical protein n=1 Tax=Danaus chrysippus TaxID=151541 RepID=A0A8J2QM56_9NEOP|nr:unnamed protein product [Danaus chrysippus]
MRSVSVRGWRHSLRAYAPHLSLVNACMRQCAHVLVDIITIAEEWPPALARLTVTMFMYYFYFCLVVSLSCIELLRRKARCAGQRASAPPLPPHEFGTPLASYSDIIIVL